MHSTFLTTIALFAISATSAMIPRAESTDSQDFRSISFNIRYAAPAGKYEKPWATRGPLVIDLLKKYTSEATKAGSIPTIGLQEVLHAQLKDIKAGLGDSWAHLGTGRDDGEEAGEFVPVLYQSGVLKLLNSTQKWLSPTPDKPSFWPNAGSRRYVIVSVFEVIKTGKKVIVANTHLDNVLEEARVEGVKIALKTVNDAQATYGKDVGVVLTGDFNSEPGDGDAYGAAKKDGLLQDLHTIASKEQRFGNEGTSTGFNPNRKESDNERIDFVWLGPNAKETWKVRRYEVLSNVVDSVWMSDHRAVVGDVTLT